MLVSSSIERLHLSLPPPLISGFNKETKLVRSPVPFGYYYQSFIEAILDTPRLLLAGFSGLDPHVMTWLLELEQLHVSRARVVWIDKFMPSELATINDLRASGLVNIKSAFPPKDEALLDKIMDHLES